MNNRISPRIGWALMALVGVACTADQPTQTTTTQGVTVTVSDNTFAPNSALAAVGTRVTWQWQGTLQHSVVFDNNDPGSALQAAGTFDRTFGTAGSYTYHCQIHGAAGMTGIVTVTSSGGGTPPPPPGPYSVRE